MLSADTPGSSPGHRACEHFVTSASVLKWAPAGGTTCPMNKGMNGIYSTNLYLNVNISDLGNIDKCMAS